MEIERTEGYVDGMLLAYEDCAKLADNLTTIPEDFLALAEHDFRKTMADFAKAVRAKAAATKVAWLDAEDRRRTKARNARLTAREKSAHLHLG